MVSAMQLWEMVLNKNPEANMAFTPGWGMNGGRVSCITERNWDREVASFLRGGDCRADIFI